MVGSAGTRVLGRRAGGAHGVSPLHCPGPLTRVLPVAEVLDRLLRRFVLLPPILKLGQRMAAHIDPMTFYFYRTGAHT